MFKIYEMVKTSKSQTFNGRNGKTVTIPKGTLAYIVEKKENNSYLIEFIDKKDDWPLAFGCFDDEIEKAE